MVDSRGHVLGLEIFRSEFMLMDQRKALVFLGCHAFPETHGFLLSSRGRKERAFVSYSFHSPLPKLMMCSCPGLQ
jgi:hypothetical protein